MEKDLDKLGTVLSIMLDKLDAQQKRQTRIIWFSIFALVLAFLIVGWTVHVSFRSIDNLSHQIEQNRVIIQEVLQDERATKTSKAAPK